MAVIIGKKITEFMMDELLQRAEHLYDACKLVDKEKDYVDEITDTLSSWSTIYNKICDDPVVYGNPMLPTIEQHIIDLEHEMERSVDHLAEITKRKDKIKKSMQHAVDVILVMDIKLEDIIQYIQNRRRGAGYLTDVVNATWTDAIWKGGDISHES